MGKVEIIIPENFSVEEASDFRENILKLIDHGEKEFLLNFKNCNFIDSTGLGVLVGIYKRCVESGGNLTLCSINNSNVMKIFKLTRLDKVFQII